MDCGKEAGSHNVVRRPLSRLLVPFGLTKTTHSFVSGRVIPGSVDVCLDPETLQMLCSRAGMSERFMADIYRTEEWTKLNFSSQVVREPATRLGP